MSSEDSLHNSLPLQPSSSKTEEKIEEEKLTRTQRFINIFKFKWILQLIGMVENYFENLNNRRKQRVEKMQERVNLSLTLLINLFRIIGYYISVLVILGFVIFIISAMIFIMSSVSYGILYSIYVPRVFTIQQPLYFEMEPLYNYDNNGKPTALFTLPPHLLQNEVSYSIHVHLHLPTSQPNQNLGNFMCRGNMISKDNTLISRSSRPAILPYKSPVHRFLYTLFYAIPLIFGFMEETELLEITLFPLFTENYEIAPTNMIEIILSAPTIEIQSATLYITTELLGLHYFLYYYFTIATSMAITFIFMIYWIAFIFALFFFFIIWKYFDLPLPPIKTPPSLYDNVHKLHEDDENDIVNNNVNNLNQNIVNRDDIEIIRIDKVEKRDPAEKPKEKIILSPSDFKKSKNVISVVERIEKDVPQSSIEQIEINDDGQVESVITSNHDDNKVDKDEEEFIELTKPYEPVSLSS